MCKEKVADLSKIVEELQKRKKDLKYTEKKFNGAMKNGELRRELYRDFQNTLSDYSERLQKRSDLLDTAHERVNTFKQYEDRPPVVTRQELQVTLSNSTYTQRDLINENTSLVNHALAQERLMLVLKMRMRLYHDHRDLEELRSILNKMMGGGKNIDEDSIIISKYKEVIGVIKRHIKEENERIDKISKEYDVENESATIIQKVWRGFSYRHRDMIEKAMKERAEGLKIVNIKSLKDAAEILIESENK